MTVVSKQRTASRKIDAVLFDLDGTIIDTQHNYRLADAEFLRQHRLPYDDAMLDRWTGRGTPMIHRLLVEEFGFQMSLEEMTEKKQQIYLDMSTDNVTVFPEMLLLVQELHRRGVPLAIASGSTQTIIERMVGAFELAGYFRALVSAESLASGKPEPDVFLEAARRVGVAPSACLVIEDAAPGIEAALAAGMMSVAVPFNPKMLLADTFYQADLLFSDGIEGFRAEAVLEWMDL